MSRHHRASCCASRNVRRPEPARRANERIYSSWRRRCRWRSVTLIDCAISRTCAPDSRLCAASASARRTRSFPTAMCLSSTLDGGCAGSTTDSAAGPRQRGFLGVGEPCREHASCTAQATQPCSSTGWFRASSGGCGGQMGDPGGRPSCGDAAAASKRCFLRLKRRPINRLLRFTKIL